MVDSGNDRVVRRLDVNVISGCCDWGMSAVDSRLL